eukprot:gnl/Chilomastix_cuspidata/7616.p1 GENE.gnl/Chilomastix_cuspidata/7616~~gnl/Chilomastix_cuspidata/7616.p1  ORF type:complete len:229 (+),score=90.06 gnl/Chilomastix_cuspidata/7616:247-933(+)
MMCISHNRLNYSMDTSRRKLSQEPGHFRTVRASGIGSPGGPRFDTEFSTGELSQSTATRVPPPVLSDIPLPPLPAFRGIDPHALLGIPDPARVGPYNICAVVTDRDIIARHLALADILTLPEFHDLREDIGTARFFAALDRMTRCKRLLVDKVARHPPVPILGAGKYKGGSRSAWAESTLEFYREHGHDFFPPLFPIREEPARTLPTRLCASALWENSDAASDAGHAV